MMPRRIVLPAMSLSAAWAALLLSGCASLPDSSARAQLRTAETIDAEASLAGEADGQWPADRWWKAFADPQLSRLIEEGLSGSPDIAAAQARFRRASAMVIEAGAARFPRIDAEGTIYEDRRSLNTGFGEQIKQFLPRGWQDGGDLAARLTYDIDLWGRNQAKLAAATSEARAAAIEAEAARLLLATGIADAYADLGRLFAERDIRQAALDIRLVTQKLVSDRVTNGLDMRGSLRQADAGVATARSSLAEADRQIEIRRHQIAALTGAGPDRGAVIARPALSRGRIAALPHDATTGLIGRRPDIVSARERAAAAARRIDVARADFFPAIRLDALIGLQSLGLDSLFEKDSLYGRVGPAVSLPIFHGGELRGRYRQAEAAYDGAVADYDGTVVEAYRQVADVVTSRAFVVQRLENAREALAASEEAYSIARQRYEGGLSGYLDVLVVEDRLLDAQLAVAELEASTRQLDIALIRALGGGFGTMSEDPGRETTHG